MYFFKIPLVLDSFSHLKIFFFQIDFRYANIGLRDFEVYVRLSGYLLIKVSESYAYILCLLLMFFTMERKVNITFLFHNSKVLIPSDELFGFWFYFVNNVFVKLVQILPQLI